MLIGPLAFALALGLTACPAAAGTSAGGRDLECKRANDWLAENNFPERIDCLALANAPGPRCRQINAFFDGSMVAARLDCASRRVRRAEPWSLCGDGADNDADGRVDARDPDCRAPDTIIRKTTLRGRRVAFGFKSAGGAGAIRFECKLDSRRWRSCRSPRRYRGLDRGRHVFKVRAIDQRDRADRTPAMRRLRVGVL